MGNQTSYTPEQIADKLQLLGMLHGPQKPFVTFLTGNAGLVTSLGDLIDKIDNGTATSNDYIDVVKDIGAIVVGVALLAELVGVTLLSAPAILGIGVGLAVLDYIDEHHYSSDEMLHDITSIKDGILNWLKEFDLADDILPDFSNNEGHNENFSSPLVLDLNGNGTTSTFIAQTNTYFDMDGDGFKERTSWTESSDGLLTLDLNNDGIVTNGTELFGNNTKLTNGTLAKDGFEALSQYDLNKDNVIDAKDSIYAHLKVWIDSNSDGISTNDELKTLEELNITSINLNATETSTSEAYNTISDTSTFTQSGQTKTINDVWFYQNKSDTTYDYTTPIKESVALLPTIEGSGRVKDLQDAMNDDSVLEAKVTNLLKSASTMSFANFSTAFKDMVVRWSGTDTISATATRGVQYILNHPSGYINTSVVKVKEVYAYARDVAILEAFAGKSFSMVADGITTTDVIGTEASVAMNEAYKELQYSQMIEFLSDALYGESLSKDELITKLQTTLTTTPSDTLFTLLLSTMVYRYGLDTLENFDDTLLSDITLKTALSTNGISYSINALGEVVGTYGNGSFYLLTCKHFTTLKSLHVRNEIQHKGAQSGEEDKVA